MGSINLGNLLINMHTSAVTNTNSINGSKGSSDVRSFSQALDKAKQNDPSKTVDKKSSVVRQDKGTTKKATKSAKTENVVTKEDDEAVRNEVAAAILEVLSTELQLPVEEITSTLEELGLSPIDLLDENNFSQFITNFYEESTVDLLMENTKIKDISKLFTKIQEVSTQVMGEEIHKIIEEVAVTDEMLAKKTQVTVTEETAGQSLEEMVGTEEIVNSIWKPKEEKTLTSKIVVSQDTYQAATLPIDHLGLSIPVEAFESTISLTNDQVQTSQNAGGVYVNPDLNLASQIVDHIEVTKLEQMQEIKMQLSPKELGQLTIKLVEKNGMLVAEIKVESEKTKDFILNEMNTLKESLSEQGIEINHVQVDVKQNDNTSQMQQQRQKSSKRIQEIIAKHLQELEEEELEMREIEALNVGESEVDYMI